MTLNDHIVYIADIARVIGTTSQFLAFSDTKVKETQSVHWDQYCYSFVNVAEV